MNTYPYMCRDGHLEIGHADSENELCPLCAIIAQRDALAAQFEAEHMSHSCTIAEEHESRAAFQERIRELEAALREIVAEDRIERCPGIAQRALRLTAETKGDERG